MIFTKTKANPAVTLESEPITPLDPPERRAPPIGIQPASPLGSMSNKPVPVAISFEDFNAFYGDFQAIHHINLQIPSKQVTGFIGPSGCGKTTLLRWINRMNDIVPTARATGKLQLHALDVLAPSTDVVELRRQVGIVFQKPNPFPKSIYDNVAYGRDCT